MVLEPPSVAPLCAAGGVQREEEHWSSFDSSLSSVSFGFAATAILISMFVVMALFERFLRPRSTSTPDAGQNPLDDVEVQMVVNRKLNYPSPKMTTYSSGVSVLMPGEEVPTYIAHPAPPTPCPSSSKWTITPASQST